jgi:hypothetical protein
MQTVPFKIYVRYSDMALNVSEVACVYVDG